MVMVWSWSGDGLVEVKAPQQTRRLARGRATGVGVGRVVRCINLDLSRPAECPHNVCIMWSIC